jgi:sugar transferase (PEP-CTERM/EpsH1 system associated)
MEDLLFLAHRIPYPPNKGDKIRSYHLLKHLAQRYRVHLATFIDDPDDWQHVERVEQLCASSHFAKLDPRLGRLRSMGALLGGRALSQDYYRNADLRAYVDHTMEAHAVKRIVVFSSPMAQYCQAYPQARRIIDFCDVDSDKWRQYAEKKSGPMKLLYAYEARHLLQYERQVALESDAALFVSAPEAELFRKLAPESASRIGFFNNGVDTAYFSPDENIPNPFKADQQALVFCGAMDYWPNVDAVSWFAKEVLPTVRKTHPQAVFYIVGARPSTEVSQLGALPGVVVTGTVPDVRPYVAHASVCVAPLRVARGIQNKVLEAMSMAKTVVVTQQALEGIKAEPGRDLLLATDAAALASTVQVALNEPDPAIGRAARATVESLYGWSSNLTRVDTLLEAASAPRSAV